ncbi:MAG: deoxyribodipyrimidine photo-lyase [Proteobacteria bacterium]|nr:MAG: deoxyribodipyrimidine photo-lyase [Pseudomonadota bacterium]
MRMDISIVWFRRDLRLLDNEAVSRATTESTQCLYIFIIDPWFFKQPEIGLLRVKFMFECLSALDDQLQKYGNRLIILNGESVATMSRLIDNLKSHGYHPKLYFNHDIQVSYGRQRDDAITAYCDANNIPLATTYNYFLLHDEAEMDDWWKRYYDYQYADQFPLPDIRPEQAEVRNIVNQLDQFSAQTLAKDLSLTLPTPTQTLFVGGENAARQAVYSFIKDRVNGYRWKISRPFLAQNGATSLLGPHLAFGTISNRAVFQAAAGHRTKVVTARPKKAFDIATYLDRLRWRDSFTQRLWFHPDLIWKNRFAEFDDVYNEKPLTPQQQDYFDRWKNGTTGFPLLDAAMTQLKHDGFINFRMRAMAATFLTINCGVSWHHGARHFMNCLVDGDIAINHWQWQMQAGITNPLSPTFRMYSPTKNLRDRDSSAAYVHFWLPETRGKDVDAILSEATPMLDFNETRKVNGKIISDLRKQTRERIIAEKGIELEGAETAHAVVKGYTKRTADRYKRYIKD